MSDWRPQVLKKIEALIKDDLELAEILFYLGHQDDACKGYQNSGVWKMLRDNLSSDRAFEAYLKRILQETKINKVQIQDAAVEVYNQMCLNNTSRNVTFSKLDITELTACGSVGFAYAWSCISAEAQARILNVLPHLAGAIVTSTAQNAVALTNAFGKKASIALAAVYLSFEAMKNINRWWNGEISGERLAKNIIDSLATVGAGFAGGAAGAALGTPLGPFGIVIGGVIGSIAMSMGTSVLINLLTQEIFNIPKDEALEKAYKFLNVNRKSTSEEINKAFKALCLKYHPDKGGSKEMFLKLQTYMGIIKVARGEKYY